MIYLILGKHILITCSRMSNINLTLNLFKLCFVYFQVVVYFYEIIPQSNFTNAKDLYTDARLNHTTSMNCSNVR